MRTGLLLDADYVTVEGRAEVRLWVRVGDQVEVLHARGFEPYFYAVPGSSSNPSELAKSLETVEVDGTRPARTEVVTRVEGLKQREVVRVVTRHPQDVPKLRTKVRNHEGVAGTREDDVVFAARFLIDQGLQPLDGVRFDASPHPKLDGVLLVKAIEAAPAPDLKLRLLCFDLEVYNPLITPRKDEDPIIAVSVATNTGFEAVLMLEGSEAVLIRQLVEVVREHDPDVLVTYNGDNFDFPYLAARARVVNVPLRLGRDGSAPKSRPAGAFTTWEVMGRAHLDAYRMARRDLPEVKVKTLDKVASHLGLVDEEERENLDSSRMAELWDKGERDRIRAYALDDARSALMIAESLLPLQVAMCRLTRQGLTDETRMGRGRQVDWVLLAEARKRNMIAPEHANTDAGETQYEGAIVLDPPRGVHENVVYLDFSSMYPTIIAAHNISPETLADADSDGAERVPGLDVAFLKEPPGFIPQVIQGLLDRRADLKARRRRGEGKAQLLEVEEQAVKVLTNAMYGYLGWPGGRWYARHCAEATAAWGRHAIRSAIDEAKELGLSVLYSDTDSLFVVDDDRIGEFARRVGERLELDLDVKDRFRSILFTGAKKRYAGISTDGEIVVRGLEVRRGDWCQLAKTVQERLLRVVLETGDANEGVKVVSEAIQRLERGEFDRDELVIHKTLTMPISQYKAKQGHVAALEKAMDKDRNLKPIVGAKYGFIIVEGRDAVVERARLVDYLGPAEKPDPKYYIEHQILPSALRVLEPLGKNEDDLRHRPKQHNLGDFL